MIWASVAMPLTYERSLKIKEKNTNYKIRVAQTDYQTFNGQNCLAQIEDYSMQSSCEKLSGWLEKEFPKTKH